MKTKVLKCILTLSAIIGFQVLYSQTIDEIPLRNVDIEYLEIISSVRSSEDCSLPRVFINYGQRKLTNKSKMKDKQGRTIYFKSGIDAVNYWAVFGYKLINSFAIQVDDRTNYHYIMQKEN